MGTKITELATITDIASNDLLTGVDVSDTSGSANGTNKKFTKASLLSGVASETYQLSGWNPLGETLAYVSVDDPTGVVKVVGKDITDKLSVGMRLMFTNGGNVIKAIITAIAFSADTTITFLHEIDPTDSQALTLMGNSAITLPYFSSQKAPYGFPLDPDKWTVKVSSSASQDATVSSVSGTVYPVTNLNITIPIGIWNVKYLLNARVYNLNAAADLKSSFSTASNSATNTEYSSQMSISAITSGQIIQSLNNYFTVKNTAKTPWYVVMWASLTGCGFGIRGDLLTCFVKATCAYL